MDNLRNAGNMVKNPSNLPVTLPVLACRIGLR
jgi:hypothetical protein